MTPRPVGRWCHRLRGMASDEGFTLIEVVVAFVIFMIVAGAGTLVIITGQHSARTTNTQVASTNIAQQEIERARALPRASLTAAPTQTTTTTLGGQSYSATRTISYLPANTPCPTGVATDAPHKIAVTVTVTSSTGRTVRMDTVLAC